MPSSWLLNRRGKYFNIKQIKTSEGSSDLWKADRAWPIEIRLQKIDPTGLICHSCWASKKLHCRADSGVLTNWISLVVHLMCDWYRHITVRSIWLWSVKSSHIAQALVKLRKYPTNKGMSQIQPDLLEVCSTMI